MTLADPLDGDLSFRYSVACVRVGGSLPRTQNNLLQLKKHLVVEDGEALRKKRKNSVTVPSIISSITSSSPISSELPLTVDRPRWYVAYTWARHEKKVAQHFAERGIAYFLPLYTSIHNWNKRRVEVSLPLFPGYIFVHTHQHARYKPLSVPGVAHFVGTAKAPTEISAEEIELLQKAILMGRAVEPHPYLAPGNRVRIASGPMSGVTGTIQRTSAGCRIIISVDMIMRSVAVEVDAACLTAA